MANGTNVVLECAVNGNPKPNVTWTKGSASKVKLDGRVKIVGGGNLQFSPVRLEDAGHYTCVVQSNGFRMNEQAHLTVHRKLYLSCVPYKDVVVGGSKKYPQNPADKPPWL